MNIEALYLIYRKIVCWIKNYFFRIVASIFDRKKDADIIRTRMRFKGRPVNITIGLSLNIKRNKRAVVCIKENNKIYKVIAVKSGSDGSINALFPYCKDKKAYVFQYIHDYKPGAQKIFPHQIKKEYIVNDQSKLSIHKTGFVQLSGEGILSGFDVFNGKPRGIGLFSNPLDYPVFTGPTFGFQCWGVANGFEELTTRRSDTQYLVLEKSDCHPEVFDHHIDLNSYSLEFWIFPKQANNYVYEYDGESYIDHTIGNYIHHPFATFTHPVLDIKGFNGVLALFAKTNWCQYANESEFGYSLGSPGGIGSKYEKNSKQKHSFRLLCPRNDKWPMTSNNPPILKY